jgi:hypothetical protein
MAAVLAARGVSQHRAKAVRVLTITDTQQKPYQFQTKWSMAQVFVAFGDLMQAYVARLQAQNAAATQAKAEREARLHQESEEKRKADIREQAAAIAQAVAPQGSLADELAKLAKLRTDGVLSDEEFATQKARLLS